jgi:hypothetical protein
VRMRDFGFLSLVFEKQEDMPQHVKMHSMRSPSARLPWGIFKDTSQLLFNNHLVTPNYYGIGQSERFQGQWTFERIDSRPVEHGEVDYLAYRYFDNHMPTNRHSRSRENIDLPPPTNTTHFPEACYDGGIVRWWSLTLKRTGQDSFPST